MYLHEDLKKIRMLYKVRKQTMQISKVCPTGLPLGRFGSF